MTAPTVTIFDLKGSGVLTEVGLKEGARLFRDRPITAEMLAEAGATIDNLLCITGCMKNEDVDRRTRLWLADCAAHVLHLYKKDEVSCDPRPAIIAARRYARGEPGQQSPWSQEKEDTWLLTWAIGFGVSRAPGDQEARYHTLNIANDAVCATLRSSPKVTAWESLWDIDAAHSARWMETRDAERGWQLNRLVAWLSDPEPQDWPLPDWQAHTEENAI